jgi:general secretion pathway protein F
MQEFRAIIDGIEKQARIVTLTAESFEAAQAKASALGATLLSGRPASSAGFDRVFSSGNYVLKIDEVVFCTQLKSLLSAGLSLQECIKALSIAPSSNAQSLLLSVIDGYLKKGLPFSSALAESQLMVKGVSPLLISMLRSAEQTSELAQALTRYVSYASQVNALKQKFKVALIYPSFLLSVGALVVLFLLFFVVPRFAGIYDSVRVDLPFAAKLLLLWGKWVKEHGYLFIILLAALFGLLFILLKSQNFQGFISGYLFKIPRLSIVIRSVKMARLYRTLSMLIEGGMPIKLALNQLSADSDINIRRSIYQVLHLVEQGRTLTESFDAQGLFVGVAKSLISAGEASGNLGAMLAETAQFLEEDAFRSIDKFMRLLEPALMALLGLIIGGIVILIYMPIFELAGSLQ